MCEHENVLKAGEWILNEGVTFLNHGSFGSCAREVLEYQFELKLALERDPVQFMLRRLEELLDAGREALGELIGADYEDIAPVGNATMGVNAVLRSTELETGDEILITNHGYNACNNAARFVADRCGGRVVVVVVPFPAGSEDEVVGSIVDGVSERTRIAVVGHVTSSSGMVFPIRRIVRALAERGVDTLVDGAHGLGQVDVDVQDIGAAYYTGNCHKWLGAPKGAGFLYVRKDRQGGVRPTVISHAANAKRRNRSRFLMEFDWMGTGDPTAFLSVGKAIEFISRLHEDGLPGLMARNHALVVAGRRLLMERLGIDACCPDEMLGAMASMLVGRDEGDRELVEPRKPDITPVSRLQERLYGEFNVEVPVFEFPNDLDRCLRISAYAYNGIEDYERLAEALEICLADEIV